MLWENIHFVLTVGAGAMAFLFQFGALMLRIGRAEFKIHEQITDIKYETDLEIQKLRQTIVEALLDVANNYLKKDTFQTIMSNLDSRLIRLEAKLDKAIEAKA